MISTDGSSVTELVPGTEAVVGCLVVSMVKGTGVILKGPRVLL